MEFAIDGSEEKLYKAYVIKTPDERFVHKLLGKMKKEPNPETEGIIDCVYMVSDNIGRYTEYISIAKDITPDDWNHLTWNLWHELILEEQKGKECSIDLSEIENLEDQFKELTKFVQENNIGI